MPTLDTINLESYDIISFDLFDTLLLRRVLFPNDMFWVVGWSALYRNELPDDWTEARFKKARIDAEYRARVRAETEIDLDDIYAEFADKEGFSAEEVEKLKSREIRVEENHIDANPYVLEFYEHCIAQGKRVILVSDMYLPHDAVEWMLERKGIAGYERLFMSSTYRKTKYEGDLFPFVASEMGVNGSKILHIGDNYNSDVIIAQKQGWNAHHYPSVREAAIYANDIRFRAMYQDGYTFHDSYLAAWLMNKQYAPRPFLKLDDDFRFGYNFIGAARLSRLRDVPELANYLHTIRDEQINKGADAFIAEWKASPAYRNFKTPTLTKPLFNYLNDKFGDITPQKPPAPPSRTQQITQRIYRTVIPLPARLALRDAREPLLEMATDLREQQIPAVVDAAGEKWEQFNRRHIQYMPTARYFDYDDARIDYLINYSDRFRYIYVETPKVACSSIKYYLQYLEVDGDKSRIPRNPHHRDQSPLPRVLAGNNRPHFERVLQSGDYYLFSFVRNPYSRVLSCYLDKIVGTAYERKIRLPQLGYEPDDEVSFVEFLERVREQPQHLRDIHWSPQWYLMGVHNGLEYDFIGRFENFQSEFEDVLDYLQGDNELIQRTENKQVVKTSANDKVLRYYNEAEKQLVDEIYTDDFHYFGYEKDLQKA